MPGEYPINPKELRAYNIVKFKGIPPSWDQIQKVIKKSGLKFQSRFEMIWGIPHKMLTQVKNGDKELPARYWHIFLDFDNIIKQAATKRKLIQEIKQVPKSKVLSNNKNILDEFKNKRQPA